MRFINLIIMLFVFINISSANELKYETSPYLLQHASNPINWYAWNEKTLLKAKKENKPIFLSIGYSTCHWCHVMAEESFENEELAKLFNKYFISIKVDKEEMPHLDSKYQELFKKVNNHSGGWPLNIFLTSDKKPFYMQVYIPAKSSQDYIGFDKLLPDLYFKYKNNLLEDKIKAIDKLSKQKYKRLKNTNTKISVSSLIDSINESYDDLSSGFGISSKFPEASKINLMMDLALLGDSKQMHTKSLDMLDAMALLGLYDHIDGGFFRYTINVDWEIPHFEKMLYTQAEMISVYSRAYVSTNKNLYKNIVDETIDMLDKRFMKNDLYFSASDAGSGHNEGKYFVFSISQIKDTINKNKFSKEIRESLDNVLDGNFLDSSSSLMVHLNFHTKDRPKGFKEFKKELSKIRDAKKYPFIDKKINTAWNSLMIEALYKASILDYKYKIKADKHLSALTDFMFNKGELYHQALIEHKVKEVGFLEDYSYMIGALIAAYESGFDEEKLNFATYLLSKAKEKFYKKKIWYASDDNLNIKADLLDSHYISALSKMIQNIIKLSALKYSRAYESLARDSIESVKNQLQDYQANVSAIARAYLMLEHDVVILKNTKEVLLKNKQKIQKIKYPYVLLKKDKYKKYIACTMKSCFGVSDNLNEIQKIIELK